MNKHIATLGLAALMSTATLSAHAANDDADRLGKDLTCMGAEVAGNADGSIPAYSGKWVGVPDHVKFEGTGTHHPDPYAGEKPLYVVTAQNMDQYADKLSEGLKGLLKRYPDTFQIPVYPSHRDFGYPAVACDYSKQNAASSKLIDDGTGIAAQMGGAMFPFPKDGVELMWNHQLSRRAWTEDGFFDQAVVYPNGNIAWGQVNYRILSPAHDQANPPKTEGTQAYFYIKTTKPQRQKGEIIVGNQSYRYVAEPRQTWQYNPGTRRVRQLPAFGFDMAQGPGGFRTVDDDRVYNESPERYNWKIVGKKELIVPYNAYKMDDPNAKYADMLSVGHLNPDYTRYELHRMWVVEATLKADYRHQYAKRVFYFDEDTYHALMSDSYDSHGELWRVSMQNYIYAYELKGYQPRVTLYHDLVSGAYMSDRMINELPAPELNAGKMSPAQFTPDAARMGGR